MKKRLTALLLSLLACSAWAESIDQEGRKWITASDLKTVKVDKALEKDLKRYVLLHNDILFCYFPEVFYAPNQLDYYLDRWEKEEPDRFSLYTRIFYRLPYAELPKDVLDMKDMQLHDEFSYEPLQKIYKKYKTYLNVKNKKQCKKVGEYIHNDLLTK